MSQSGYEHVNSDFPLGIAAIDIGLFIAMLTLFNLKVNITLQRPSKVQRGSRGIALLFL